MDSRALLIQQQFQDLNAADQLVQVVREQQGGTTYQKWTFVDTDRHTYHLGLRQSACLDSSSTSLTTCGVRGAEIQHNIGKS